jgi:hypothetical protein
MNKCVLYCYVKMFRTPSVSFYLSLDRAILHYPATNKKKRREYTKIDECVYMHI